ncbi:hypothetical protein CMI37_32060 [Candidatus Pacearchaeota archaeon]|nr:hypothetical protein [Candidatus Pacearchaeota archaeon]
MVNLSLDQFLNKSEPADRIVSLLVELFSLTSIQPDAELRRCVIRDEIKTLFTDLGIKEQQWDRLS